MKPTGYSIAYVNDIPIICLDGESESDCVTFTLTDAEKVMRWIAEAIDKVKTDEQKTKFREYLDRASKEVATWPGWQRDLMGKAT